MKGGSLMTSASFFKLLIKQEKTSSAHDGLKFRAMCKSFWECTRREKSSLKRVVN